MNLSLENRAVLISGGARGIGRAVALLVAAEGGCAVIVDPQKAEAEAVVAEVKNLGGAAVYLCELLDSDAVCKRVVEQALAETGRIDGLVNNAGRNDGAGLENGDTNTFEASLRNNLLHCFALTHHALPSLKAAAGAIVNVSSKTALVGQGGTSGYVAAKGALLALTREWSLELAHYPVRVNAVVPAEVRTPAYSTWLDQLENPEQTLQQIESRVPLGNRLTTPEEIADTIVFLLSQRASHITGQFIHVDGGYVHLDRALGSIRQQQGDDPLT